MNVHRRKYEKFETLQTVFRFSHFFEKIQKKQRWESREILNFLADTVSDRNILRWLRVDVITSLILSGNSLKAIASCISQLLRYFRFLHSRFQENFIAINEKMAAIDGETTRNLPHDKAEITRNVPHGSDAFLGEFKLSMWIPAELGGKVIGLKGIIISNIETETKCKMIRALKPVGQVVPYISLSQAAIVVFALEIETSYTITV